MKTNDAVLLSALRVPFEMAFESELGRKIFHSQAQVAAERIVTDAVRIIELEAELATLSKHTAFVEQNSQIDLVDEPKAHPVAESKIDSEIDSKIEPAKQLGSLSDEQILMIAQSGKLLIRDSEIALRFARAVLEAARIERLSDEKIVMIAHETKTPIHTGKGALRFSRILLAEVNQLQAA